MTILTLGAIVCAVWLVWLRRDMHRFEAWAKTRPPEEKRGLNLILPAPWLSHISGRDRAAAALRLRRAARGSRID